MQIDRNLCHKFQRRHCPVMTIKEMKVYRMTDLQPSYLRLAGRTAALLAAALVLVACKGIDPAKSPGKTFEVNVPVKTAYERAIAQSEMCLVTEDRFPMTTQLDPAGQFALVRVNMSMTNTLLSNVRIVAQSPSQSRVSIQMWGVDPWNMTAVDAMQAAIEFGVPSCINYFPSQAERKR